MVALQQSSEQTANQDDTPEDSGIFVRGAEVLEEALELVRTLAAGPIGGAGRDSETAGEFAETRTQLRVNTSIAIKVLMPGNSKPVEARLENISWGGAAVILNQDLETDELVRIILPRPQGGSISIEARILRSWRHDDGYGISVRFSSLSTRDEANLEDILESLVRSTGEDGQRMHARLAQRLDIEFNGIAELQSTLDDISTGGLRITVRDPLTMGQSIQTVISTLDDRCSLKLRARVVRQKPVKLPNGEFYQVGLKFEHPTEELRRRVQDLVAQAATIRNT